MRVLIGLVFVCAAQASAAYDWEAIEGFDTDTGLYFRPMYQASPKQSCFSCDAEGNEFIANLFIYDPAKKTGRNLFHKSPGVIENITVETEYDVKEHKMLFLGEGHIRNNRNVRPRKPNSQFLIETYACSDDKHCLYTIWKADKAGGEPTVLFTFSKAEAYMWNWQLDVKNKVVRLWTKKGDDYTVEEFAW